MHIPELADKILTYCLDHQSTTVGNISDDLSIPRHSIMEAIRLIQAEKSNFIQITKHQRFTTVNLLLSTPVRDFVFNQGGFTLLHQTLQESKELESAMQQQELHKLQLEIRDLQQRPLEQRSTRRLSQAAIAVAIAALLWSILSDACRMIS